MENENDQMPQAQEYVVDGFVFHSRTDAQKAQRERDGVNYLIDRADLSESSKVLALYNRILTQKLFDTQIGMCFIRDLQRLLRTSDDIDDETIMPIDIELSTQAAVPRVKRQEPMAEKKDEPGPGGRGILIFFNVVLTIIVIAMFVIAFMSNSSTIVNYENDLVDKYESWEQTLEEREQVIKEYEDMYGISGSGSSYSNNN